MYHEEAAACTYSHVVITINDTVENWVLFYALLFSSLFAKSSNTFFWNTFNVNAFLNIFLALQMKSDMPGLLQLCVTFTKNMLYILYISQYGHICIGIGSELSKVDWYISKSPWSENIHYYTFICFRSCQSTIKQYNIRGSAVILSLIKCVMPTL